MAANVGTPVASLSKGEAKSGLMENVRAAAWVTTRLAVVKPLLAAAPAAKAATALVFEELVQLLPEHVAAEVAVALGSFVAKTASLLSDTAEGDACKRAMLDVYADALACCSTKRGQALAVDSSEAIVRLVKALKSTEARQFYDACERATHTALRAAASPEAARLVSTARAALDAAIDLAASDAATDVVRDAVDTVASALEHHRTHRTKTVADNDTLSECESDDDDDDRTAPLPIRLPRPPPPHRRTANLAGLCFLAFLVTWTLLAALGIVLVVAFRNDLFVFVTAAMRRDDALVVEAPRPATPSFDKTHACDSY